MVFIVAFRINHHIKTGKMPVTSCGTKVRTSQHALLYQAHSNFSSRLLLRNGGCFFGFIQISSLPLVVRTVVFARLSAVLCPDLPQFNQVRFIVQLPCRGRRKVLVSYIFSFLFAVVCRVLRGFARGVGIYAIHKKCGSLCKIRQNLAKHSEQS